MKLRCVLAATSFVIYAVTAVVAIRQWPSSWDIEYELSIPTAISNVVYGLPLGLIDSNVLAEFKSALGTKGFNPKSAEEAVEVAARGDLPQGTIVDTPDGIGIGQVLFVDLAMRLFGPRLMSMPYCFLLLMGLSTLAFVGRYKDDRLIFVPLQYVALTCMLMTQLVTEPSIRDQIPISGNRFFGILGILPALHIFFDFTDGADAVRNEARKNWLFLGVQSLILVLTLLVRSANAYMLAPAICAGVFSVRRVRYNRAERLRLYRKLASVAIMGIVFTSVLIACVPNYVKFGRIGGLFWHRAFISFSIHPDWPFGNLNEVYKCTKYIPEGLQRDRADRNGHCVWWAYPPNQIRPASEVMNKVYGPEYEAVLRSAFFNVIFSYPRQGMQLFLYYKPMLILDTLKRGLDWKIVGAPKSILFLAVLQAAIFVWFVVATAAKTPFKATTTFGTLGLFSLFSLAPQLVAWSSLWTSVDLIFYMYAAFWLMLALAASCASANTPFESLGCCKRSGISPPSVLRTAAANPAGPPDRPAGTTGRHSRNSP
jgi:hypothetical protein